MKDRPTERVSIEQLITRLSSIRGSRLVTLVTETVPTLNQKADDGSVCPWFNPQASTKAPDAARWFIRKKTVVSMSLIGSLKGESGTPYERSVNRRRCKESQDFQLSSPPQRFRSSGRHWGTRRKSAPLVDYKGRVYLDAQRTRILSFEFIDTRTGRTISQTQLKPWIPGSRNPSKTQLLANEIVWRDYRIDRVRIVRTLGGVECVVARRAKISTHRETREQQLSRRKQARASHRKPNPRMK